MSSSLPPQATRTLEAVSNAPDYFAAVGRALERIGTCRSEAELLRLLHEATTHLGADSSFFMSFVREGTSFESYRFLLACDPLWCLEYERAACYVDDPWRAYAAGHSEPTRGSEIACASDRQQAVVRLAERFGFRSTAIIPAPTGGGLSRIGMLVLGSAAAGFFEAEGYLAFKVLARSLAMELHESCTALIRDDLIHESGLSPLELSLLAYERDGIETKTIAKLLRRSEEAIDCRFRRVNAKLNAPNRKLAARLAAEYGLI